MSEDVPIELYTKMIICDILDCPMAREPFFKPKDGKIYKHCGSYPCIKKLPISSLEGKVDEAYPI